MSPAAVSPEGNSSCRKAACSSRFLGLLPETLSSCIWLLLSEPADQFESTVTHEDALEEYLLMKEEEARQKEIRLLEQRDEGDERHCVSCFLHFVVGD